MTKQLQKWQKPKRMTDRTEMRWNEAGIHRWREQDTLNFFKLHNNSVDIALLSVVYISCYCLP